MYVMVYENIQVVTHGNLYRQGGKLNELYGQFRMGYTTGKYKPCI